uniref:Calmodulin n=1 Tax=Trepomonas sp. PC1 TaxID=1076344 RepID=A0A146K4W6_9EUKA|eukprot:JAP91932.1 Calmodulin [Trepomonas sp. PC1]
MTAKLNVHDCSDDQCCTHQWCHERCKEMFEEMDTNKDGFIQYIEMKAYLELKGEKICKKSFELFNSFDKNDDGKLDFQEFHELMVVRLKTHEQEQEQCCTHQWCHEKCDKMFEEMDTNKDGFIQYIEVKAYMEMKGEKICKKSFEVFNNFDKNNDGKLDRKEFHDMMVARLHTHAQ